PSEHQDWEPPQWLHEILATDTVPPADEDQDERVPADRCPDHGQPMNPRPHPDAAPTGCPGQHPAWDPELDLPRDPGRDPNLALPEDPFPDWYQVTARHQFPAADTDDPGWPLDDPYLEELPLLYV
ncbi:MAG TPA: hypothetical protein VLR70_02825, partial [Arthrobacter sp.]|nr:hypothetical protein [Arthrobacter sp.]